MIEMSKVEVKFYESKTREYIININGIIKSRSKKTGKEKTLMPIFEEGRGPRVKIGTEYRKSMNNLMWETFKGEIPIDCIVRQEDNDMYNCALNNLYLDVRSNLEENSYNSRYTKYIPVVCYNEYLGHRHFKDLAKLTIFLNRDFVKYEEQDIIKIFNNCSFAKFDKWDVETILSAYGEDDPEDIMWDEAFPSFDEDDNCVILNLNCSVEDGDGIY